MRPPVRITPPAEMPVTLEEAKAHLRVDHADDDAMISAFIAAATEHLDGYRGVLGRALVNQTWRQDFDGFCRVLRLPFPDVSEATVAYDDASGTVQTVGVSDYRILADGIGPYLAASLNTAWPSSNGAENSVRVTFTAGFGTAAEVPSPIKAAILLMVGDLYEHRQTASERGAGKIDMSMTVDRLISPYRRWSV